MMVSWETLLAATAAARSGTTATTSLPKGTNDVVIKAGILDPGYAVGEPATPVRVHTATSLDGKEPRSWTWEAPAAATRAREERNNAKDM